MHPLCGVCTDTNIQTMITDTIPKITILLLLWTCANDLHTLIILILASFT